MHTVELLEQAICVVKKLGYRIREEWLDGKGGGDCQIKGVKWLFVDLALSPDEQLEVVMNVLRKEPNAIHISTSEALHRLILFEHRKAA